MEFYEDLKKEIKKELQELGPVETVKIFERNPEGVVAVKFKYPLTAQRCVRIMNGRFFDKKKIFVDFYDEFTNYNVQETEEQRLKRQKEFDLWIGNISNENEDNLHSSASSSSTSGKVFRFSSLEGVDEVPILQDNTDVVGDVEVDNEDTLDQLKNILDNDYSNSSSSDSDDSDSSGDD